MQLFSRLKTGLVLTKDSVLLIRHNPRLALFPLVSGAAGLAFLAIFLGITFGMMSVASDAGAVVGLFLTYLGLTFISSFFAAGLVHQTREVLAGEEPSLKEGLAAAWDRRGALIVWAVISATVGLIINAIENSDSRIARVVGLIFGVAWTLMTFFIVPVIVFERPSIKEMFTKSAGTFKQTWGETPISLIGVQVVALAVALPFVAVGIGLFTLGTTILAVGVILIGVLLAFLVTQTLQGVVKTTLYLYASDGTRPEEFDNVDFDELARDERRSSGMMGGGVR
ncbi:DUF6159 family protein [Halovenus marina]|uniref:DUF6159 family protein n=1 Tax=Halovenus marina TaxID=3396621 RepID=UPI003F5437C9